MPFTQVRDLPPTAASSSLGSSINSQPIAVRHLLLSGFLLHILLPLLSRLVPLVAAAPPVSFGDARLIPAPSVSDLQRILQMSLVLSTQARYSSLFPHRDVQESERRDEEVRNNVESLGKAVRWRMSAGPSPQQHGIQRNQSINQGRHRRRGWRASTNFGQQWNGAPEAVQRQNSDFQQASEQRWGRPRADEDDEDDMSTPGQSYAYGRNGARTEDSSFAGTTSTTMRSTLTAGIARGESLASYAEGQNQRTPLADSGMARRPMRSESSGSSEVTPMAQVRR